MQEQQINFQYCPPQGQRLQVENELKVDKSSQSIAIRRVKQLYRFLPTSFTPYIKSNDLYNNNIGIKKQPRNIITLHKGHPTFSLGSLIYDRQRLSQQRQMMYCRGAIVDEIISQNIVQDMIRESNQCKGYVKKQGNKSVIVDGMLVYVDREVVKAVGLPVYKNRDYNNSNKRCLQLDDHSMNPISIYAFPEGTIILQLQLFQTDNYSSLSTTINRPHSNKKTTSTFSNNPILLSIRLSRQIVIFNLTQKQIFYRICTQKVSSEFIQCQNSIYSQNIIQTVEYNGNDSVIILWDLNNSNNCNNKNNINNNLLTNIVTKSQINLKGILINSLNKLSRNQALLTSYDGLRTLDYRQKYLTQHYSLTNTNTKTFPNQKIYSSIKLSSNFTYSPYIATCHTRHICIFDIRKLSQPIEKRLHHCQQAPPQIMSYYDGFQQRLARPVLVGWSPYEEGVAVMTGVDVDGFSGNDSKQVTASSSVLGKQFQLISHNNNTQKNSSHTFISSISLYNYSQQSLALFSTTNQGAINMHLYKHDFQRQKYQPQQIIIQSNLKQNIIQNQQIDKNISNSEKWLKVNLCDKYFTKCVSYKKQVDIEEKLVESKLAKKKKKTKSTNTSNKDKKKNTSKSLNKNNKKAINNLQLNQQQTLQIDDQDMLLDGQYDNSQQCQLSYTRRKLNFADFTNFYTTLKMKAKQQNQQQSSLNLNKKSNQLEFSLISTQANSMSYSMSQSFCDDQFKTFMFQNKKVINTSLLDRLKKQWD